MAEESADLPVAPVDKSSGVELRRYSIAKASSGNIEDIVVPHYRRASIGSCHDFCKYGRKHTSEAKERLSMVNKLPRNSLCGSSEEDIGGTKTSVANRRASVDSKLPKKLSMIKLGESVNSKPQISNTSDTNVKEMATTLRKSPEQEKNQVPMNRKKTSVVKVRPLIHRKSHPSDLLKTIRQGKSSVSAKVESSPKSNVELVDTLSKPATEPVESSLRSAVMLAGTSSKSISKPVESSSKSTMELVESSSISTVEPVGTSTKSIGELVETSSKSSAEDVEAPSISTVEEVEAPSKSTLKEVEASSKSTAEEVEASSKSATKKVEASSKSAAKKVEASSKSTAKKLEASVKSTTKKAENSSKSTANKMEASSKSTVKKLEASSRSTAVKVEASSKSTGEMEISPKSTLRIETSPKSTAKKVETSSKSAAKKVDMSSKSTAKVEMSSKSTVKKVETSPKLIVKKVKASSKSNSNEGASLKSNSKAGASSKPTPLKSKQMKLSEMHVTSLKSNSMAAETISYMNPSAGSRGQRNSKLRMEKQAATSKVAARKLMTPPRALLTTKPSLNRLGSINARKHKSLKIVSHLKNQLKTRKSEHKKTSDNEVEEKTLYVIKMESGNRTLLSDPDASHDVKFSPPQSLSPPHDVEFSPPKFSSSSQEDKEESEYTTSEGEEDSFSVNLGSEHMENGEALELKETGKPRKAAIICSDDKGRQMSKINSRRGKLAELQSEKNSSRRLKFRRATAFGENAKAENQTSFKRRYETGIDRIGATTGPEKVVLRRRGVQGKTDAHRLFNNVIEETASKLAEIRKSKVKALVGAFETVISLQERKPPVKTIC